MAALVLSEFWRSLLFSVWDLSNSPKRRAAIVLLMHIVSAAHCAFEKDYVSCLVIIKRYKLFFYGTSALALFRPRRRG